MKIIIKLSYIFLIIFFISCIGKNNNKATIQNEKERIIIGGGCDGCELMYQNMPENLSNVDTSKGWNERGQKLVIEGTVFKADSKNVGHDVVIYYWHTDSDGLYSKKPKDQSIHGHLRGWVKTDRNGKYKIYTVRPAPYPNEKIPAHIHFSIKEPNIQNEYYIDDIYFDEDRFLNEFERKKLEKRGGNGIVKYKTINNIQFITRDILLGENIPNYPK